VKIIQEGGASNQTGSLFAGAGKNKFFGCRTISDVTKEHQVYNETVDEHGEQVGRIQIDKTQKIDQFVDSLNKVVFSPQKPESNNLFRRRFMIPSGAEYQIDFFVEDMMNITRKDMQYGQQEFDKRVVAQKQYNHPPDSVMAVIYGMVGNRPLQKI